jgi:hypothetical protein
MINKRDIEIFLKTITIAEWYEIHRVESQASRKAIAKTIADISMEASKNIMKFEQVNRIKLWLTRENLAKLDILVNPGQVFKLIKRDGYDYLNIIEYTIADPENMVKYNPASTQIDLREQLKLAVEKEEYFHAARLKKLIEEQGYL